MGMMYDLGQRPGPAVLQQRYDLESTDRPTPPLDIHRTFHYHDHPGEEALVASYAEALANRPDIELVAGAERDYRRLTIFKERYGARGLYTNASEMLRDANLDILVIATNISNRAELTALAVERGVKGIVTEKPMANSLEESDLMVNSCASANVPLVCGAISTSHPSFETAKDLITENGIGQVLSIEATVMSQHQNWTYFMDSPPAWVVGTGDSPRRETGSDEFTGQGFVVAQDGLLVHFRNGSPTIRVTGLSGEITHSHPGNWRLWQDVDAKETKVRVEMPWPGPQIVSQLGTVYAVNDVIECIEGRLDEPKNSGRRVAIALEVEIALKQSAVAGGARVNLPLEDRSLRLNYDWFR